MLFKNMYFVNKSCEIIVQLTLKLSRKKGLVKYKYLYNKLVINIYYMQVTYVYIILYTNISLNKYPYK